MDPFDDLLRGVRADGAAFGRSVLTPPAALRFVDGAPLTLCVPLRGEGWITRAGGEKPLQVRVGEAVVVRGPEPFVFSTEPRSEFRPGELRDVHCGQSRVTEPAPDADPAERTVLLAGAYHVQGRAPQRLLGVLPPVLVATDDHDCASLRDYLDSQLGSCRPGRQIVLDRMLDWLLVCTLRDWFDQPGAEPPDWYRALGDDTVGPVLRAMHDAPNQPWTIASLAARAGVSRTTLAKRFTELVGEPPLTYLTDWRMTLAADLLTGSTATVAAVARQLGYADGFGFSAAFKRVHGVSPSEHRRLAHSVPEHRGATPVTSVT
ncbi:AraC family transcriptional regulator [Micromonospora sp. NBC_01699]|uniref:AraC family transcriptional regulator n=1 Tax=Micromonospora sp. NBC_01699 TaxID=2975984 RepID=UPI002E31BA8F|nr:AraC family transcriptional regulator [Micromonospora sp. NBC_01699]